MRVDADHSGDEEEEGRALFLFRGVPIRSVVSRHVPFRLGGIEAFCGSRLSEALDLW